MKPILVLGAPGTGKTYRLIEMIREIKPSNFALLSFTRRAAREARTRLSNIYSDRELRYTRTIHSMCFELLGLKTAQILSYKNVHEFAEQYGYEFTGRYYSEEDGTYFGLTDDDIEYRSMMIQVAKLKEEELTDASAMYRNYVKFKHNNSLIDFHDMIKLAIVRHDMLPKFDLFCIDEIQDLTPLQLALVDVLVERSGVVVYAGDGNQMIFEWAGVDRNRFLELQNICDIHELHTNYRIPVDIVIKSISVLDGKQWSTGYERNIHLVSCLPNFDTSESNLILARNGYILREAMKEFEEPEFSWAWLSLDLYTPMKPKFNALVSTIHGAKGAEADNIIIIPDVSPATFDNLDSAAERRVWYVGVTRAKKQLYLLEPRTDMYYDLS